MTRRPRLRAQIDERGWLKTKPESPASVLTGAPMFLDGDVTPDGYSVNTTQPPWQPSRVPPAKDGDPRGTDPTQHTLPPQTLTTIGDTLTAKGVTLGVVCRRVECRRSRTACSRPTRRAR